MKTVGWRGVDFWRERRTTGEIVWLSSRGEKIDGGVRTHVHGFVPPVADLLEVKLDRLELAKASEALGVDVGLVHEHVPLAVVAREEACAVGKKTTQNFSVTHTSERRKRVGEKTLGASMRGRRGRSRRARSRRSPRPARRAKDRPGRDRDVRDREGARDPDGARRGGARRSASDGDKLSHAAFITHRNLSRR